MLTAEPYGKDKTARPVTQSIVPGPYGSQIYHRKVTAVKYPHPVADGLIDLKLAHDRMVTIFDADGIRDDRECAVLQLFERGRLTISRHHRRELAADAFKRNGGSRHVQMLFQQAGSPLVPMDEEISE